MPQPLASLVVHTVCRGVQELEFAKACPGTAGAALAHSQTIAAGACQHTLQHITEIGILCQCK